MDPIVNFFQSSLQNLPYTNVATQFTLATGAGAKLPNPATEGQYNLVITANGYDPEIVRVTAKSGDVITVQRAQEGTAASAKVAGVDWLVIMTPTKKVFNDLLPKSGGTMTGDLTIPDKIIHADDTDTAIRFPGPDTMGIDTGGIERFRVTGAGNVGIGTTSPQYKLHVNSPITAGRIAGFYALGAGSAIGDNGFIHIGGAQLGSFYGVEIGFVNEAAAPITHKSAMVLKTTSDLSAPAERMRIASNGNVGIGTSSPVNPLTVNGIVSPSTDNFRTLGTASLRWNVIFAGSGTINTSDAVEKCDISELNEAEKQVASSLKGLIRKYRWISSVEHKGDNARIHVGVIAQDVAQAFEGVGLDPEKYGVFCKDIWYTKEEEYSEQVPNPDFDEEAEESESNQRTIDGDIKTRTVPCESDDPDATEHIRYGVRYDQLWAFIISAL